MLFAKEHFFFVLFHHKLVSHQWIWTLVDPCGGAARSRTHSQVSPNDAVVGAALPDAAAVRRPGHAHRAAPPVMLRSSVRLQHSCDTTNDRENINGLRTKSCLCLQTPPPPLTAALEPQEARQLALTTLLLVVGQQLVDELPDQLFGRSVQHRKHVNYQGVHVPARITHICQSEPESLHHLCWHSELTRRKMSESFWLKRDIFLFRDGAWLDFSSNFHCFSCKFFVFCSKF